LTLNSQRGDLVRAVLEGVAFEFRTLLDELVRLGQPCPSLRMSGGGTRSPLWRQILAAVLARPLTHYSADSTLGAAIMAAVGCGYHGNLADAVAQMVYPADTTVAAPAVVADYAAAYAVYVQWREQLYPKT
jgi:xylulokinase